MLVVGNATYSPGGVEMTGGSNMAAIHLSHFIGGDLFLGFISAVVFATILAVGNRRQYQLPCNIIVNLLARLNTRGAVIGGYSGLFLSVTLILLR